MNEKIREIKGGVASAGGFAAAGVQAGIKYKNRKDMAMVYSKTPCRVAGTFTTNVVKAACVLWDREIVEESLHGESKVHAVVVNAGIANACTGSQGYDNCAKTARAAADALGIGEKEVLVASTGVIGMQLPVEKLKNGASRLASLLKEGEAAGTQAAQSIMTTDTYAKEAAVEFEIGGKTVTLGGMCKGSGMIHPNMCTMLAFLTTDLAISKELLAEALRENVEETFNMVSVDGDTSTNDTLLLLANGMAGNPEIREKNEEYDCFREALLILNTKLAKMLAGDGEGATALIEVQVDHADTKENARRLAKSVIGSSLTKAAIFGHDANWGRILCALGYAGVAFDPEKIAVSFGGSKETVLIFEDGVAADYSEETAASILSEPEVRILVDMKMGGESACAWGCDLTYDYVKINADYRS
ncbi:MAG: bifunctional glutamate N-acetyltransferase/amino-acid acetyltransferase ArgJ [Lachnospiraceae bacterium]|nr:bifunctional glutamate N-acetyltransferase/amino-acid acetyltransferase ArgJ [Lachnospiraceae bacterium]